jgi:fumarate hydratase class II
MSLLASLVGPVAGLLDKVIPDKRSGRSLWPMKLQPCQNAILKIWQSLSWL